MAIHCLVEARSFPHKPGLSSFFFRNLVWCLCLFTRPQAGIEGQVAKSEESEPRAHVTSWHLPTCRSPGHHIPSPMDVRLPLCILKVGAGWARQHLVHEGKLRSQDYLMCRVQTLVSAKSHQQARCYFSKGESLSLEEGITSCSKILVSMS